MWCILTDRYKIDNQREVVLRHKKYFTEFYQDDIQFPIKIKDIPSFEQRNKFHRNAFDSPSFEETFSPKVINRNNDEEQIDLLL